MAADNKLRQLSFQLLHRILVSKKKLKRYKIIPDDEGFFFLQRSSRFPRTHIPGLPCTVAEDFYHEMKIWLNNEQKSQFNITTRRITTSTEVEIFIILMKKYIYDCKMMAKFPLVSQFKQKLKIQWKIENSGSSIAI